MQGTCKFCGQIVEVGQDTNNPDAIAYAYCDCIMGIHEQKVQNQIEEAEQNIELLFGKESEEMGFTPCKESGVLEVLKRVAEAVARMQINSAQISIAGGGKATIKQGSKGEVIVTRQTVRAQTMQAGLF